MARFDGFQSRVGPFIRGELNPKNNPEEFKRLICADCEFFTPGEDEELECGCYHILTRLIENGRLTLEQLAHDLEG